MILLCCNPPSTGNNWTLGRCMVTVCIGAVWNGEVSTIMVWLQSGCLARDVARGVWELCLQLGGRYQVWCSVSSVNVCTLSIAVPALLLGWVPTCWGGHWLYMQAWEVVAARFLPVPHLWASPFVCAPFVQAPFVQLGEHMAPFSDLLVGVSIRARGAWGYVWAGGVVLHPTSLQQKWVHY